MFNSRVLNKNSVDKAEEQSTHEKIGELIVVELKQRRSCCTLYTHPIC